jgi:predicted nucleotidyltransferase component of viral defense system
MANLALLAEEFKKEGLSEANAEARVCQDIVLTAIAESRLSQYVTIKGGVIMRSITGNVRRATQDIDLDFIRYSFEEDSIHRFINNLNCLEGISIKITGTIEELSLQEYRGKRVYVRISDDSGHSFTSKIDLGVHKNMQIEQEEYCFDVCMNDEGASLLINSKEQIFAEKLRALLRFGPLSTRYKDVFDLCYLTDFVDRLRLKECIKTYILDDPDIWERDLEAIRKRVRMTFMNRSFRNHVERSGRANWLRMKATLAFDKIEEFLTTL